MMPKVKVNVERPNDTKAKNMTKSDDDAKAESHD